MFPVGSPICWSECCAEQRHDRLRPRSALRVAVGVARCGLMFRRRESQVVEAGLGAGDTGLLTREQRRGREVLELRAQGGEGTVAIKTKHHKKLAARWVRVPPLFSLCSLGCCF